MIAAAKSTSTLLLIFSVLIVGTRASAAKSNAPEYKPGEYVITLKKVTPTAKDEFLKSADCQGCKIIKELRPGMYLVVRDRQELADRAVARFKANPNVLIAEPNYIYKINKLPVGPTFEKLWGLKNSGQVVQDPADSNRAPTTGVVGVDVDTERAWDITTGSRKVLVAVIDTGIDYTNSDIAPNVWTNMVEYKGKPGVDDDANGYIDDIHGYNFVANTGDPKDDHSHGTHCSGTIGASGASGRGLYGINWEVSIMGVKFLDEQGSGTLDNAVLAIDYARKNGAQIMSNSWGGGGPSDTLKKAIQDANAAGILFVAAAGNSTSDNDANPEYPASYPVENIVSVAAIDNQGTLAWFSSYGKTAVHLGAPGVGIVSTVLKTDKTPEGLDSYSGTSMATPHVAGVAALLLSQEPKFKAADIKKRLLATVRPIAGLRTRTLTGGMVDAYAALTNTRPPADPNDPMQWKSNKQLTLSTPHPYANTFTVEWTIQVPKAKRFSIHFARFETEANIDTLQILNAEGKLLSTMSGNHNDEFSAPIKGDFVKLKFTSDASVVGYGIDIDRVNFEAEPTARLQ